MKVGDKQLLTTLLTFIRTDIGHILEVDASNVMTEKHAIHANSHRRLHLSP